MIEKDIIQDQKETIRRLQEECKEKTDIIMALEQKSFIKNPVEAYEKLLKENAELKERLKNLDEEEVVYEVTETEYNNFKKYKQALEEIREMTKAVRYFPQERLELIRAKINEVLNEKLTSF